MKTIIESGGSEANKAIVDDHGRLSVKSSVVSHMSHHSSWHKNAYRKVFKTTLQGTSETALAFLYNQDSSVDIEIYKIVISSDANIETIFDVGETYSSGGNSIDVVNTNLSVSTTPTVDSYEGGSGGNLALISTNEREMNGGFIGAYAPYEHNYDGGLILTPKTGISIYGIGAANNKIKITIEFALHAKGTKL